jgi:hypothetical protein
MKHKYVIIVAIAIVCCSGTVVAHTNTSKSFFSTADFTLPQPLEYEHFWNNQTVPKENQKQISLRLYGARSTNSKSLGNYFGPFDKEKYVVKEDNTDAAVNDGSQDIMSYNFNLVTVNGDFHSELTFKPRWSKVGIELGGFFQRCPNYWVSFSAPIEQVKTDMNFKEEVISSGSGAIGDLNTFTIESVLPVGTMKDAFKQSALRYGKIDGSQKKTRLAHIQCTVGYNKWRSKKGYAQPYCGITVPTGNKPKGIYMFEPIVGNNRHFALFAGMHFGKKWWETDESLLFMSGSCQTLYRAPNTQVRSFDPGGKPWGRYLTLFNSETDRAADTHRWGVDHFTKTVKVRPHFTNTLNLYLHALLRKFTLHIGYHGIVQSAETVTLKDSWSDPAIVGILANDNKVNPARGIDNVLDNFAFASYRGIKKDELNMQSAAHDYHFNHTFSATISCQKTHRSRIFNFETGTALTTGTNNNALRHWSLWGTLATHF